MAEESKAWYKSKTIWSDIVTGLVGIYTVLVPILTAHGIKLPPIDSGLLATILSILAGLGIYGRTAASTSIAPK